MSQGPRWCIFRSGGHFFLAYVAESKYRDPKIYPPPRYIHHLVPGTSPCWPRPWPAESTATAFARVGWRLLVGVVQAEGSPHAYRLQAGSISCFFPSHQDTAHQDHIVAASLTSRFTLSSSDGSLRWDRPFIFKHQEFALSCPLPLFFSVSILALDPSIFVSQ